jgi:hypothetical protein
MKQFWNYIIGPTEPALFAACIFFAGMGIFFVLLLGTRLRDKLSPYSPPQFSWQYLWSDNARRIYASIIAVLISLRFLPDLFTGLKLTPLVAFGIGTAWDGIALVIKQKTNILDPKDKP